VVPRRGLEPPRP